MILPVVIFRPAIFMAVRVALLGRKAPVHLQKNGR